MSIARVTRLMAPVAVALAFAGSAVAQEGEAKAKADAKMKVTLEAIDESGITGKAVIAMAEDAEKPHAHAVTVNLSGAEAGTYPAHIHRGTCESGGGVAAALTSVEVEEGAEVAASTTIITPEQLASADRPLGEAEAKVEVEAETEVEGMAAAGMMEEAGMRMEHGPLFIQVHLPDGTPAACGNLTHEGKRHGEHEGKGKHEGHEGGGR